MEKHVIWKNISKKKKEKEVLTLKDSLRNVEEKVFFIYSHFLLIKDLSLK